MFNLILNLPCGDGIQQPPFIEENGYRGRQLIHGKPHGDEELLQLFRGATPYEASTMYSDDLKDLVRRCLNYRKDKRPSFQDLKNMTEKFARAKELPAGFKSDGPVIIRIGGETERFDLGKTWDPPALPGGGKKSKGKGEGERKK